MTGDVFRALRTSLVPPGEMELHVADMTATVGAEVSLANLQARLGEVGQWLPIDGDRQSPIGELVAFNSSGPLRLGYGAWRDLLLGVQFTNGRGELISAGGRTVKNVAGYDLTKFIVGSAAIFGHIATITIRTYKKPDVALVVKHRADAKIVSRLLSTSLRPQWALLNSESLRLGYLGDRRTAEYYRASLSQREPVEIIEHTVDDDIAMRGTLWGMSGDAGYRAAVPPTRINEFVEALTAHQWAADPAFGVVVGSAEGRDFQDRLRASANAVGGSVRLMTRRDRLSLLDCSTNLVERQIIERLKAAFDPDGKLNPLPWQIR